MDKVSVIMSTYKEPIEWIKQSVDSVLNQTYKNFEFIIIIDNPEYEELISLLNDYANADGRIYTERLENMWVNGYRHLATYRESRRFENGCGVLRSWRWI